MEILKKLNNNFSSLVGKGKEPKSQNNGVGLSSISMSNQELEGRQAIYPAWFFSARLGQPRQVDINKIRKLSKSVWVQMVLNTFKKQIYSLDYEIVPIDETDETDYSEKIQKVKDFMEKINVNGDNINDLDSEIITDLGEIDAATYNYVYTADSYEWGQVPVYDEIGNIISGEEGFVLKPFGKRELVQVKTADSSTFLKQIDMHKNLLQYYQYSFKHPRMNPTPFNKDEIIYLLMNRKSYSVYGFSPVQAIQQVLELLIQGTRYNKDLFTNNAIPDLLVSLPKLSPENLKKLKRSWNNEYQNKPHQVSFINWPVDSFNKLADSNRDLEWLDGQKWYFKLVFAVFGVSPTEAGFFENANQSNDKGQERVTVRNALRPFLKPMERAHTQRLIPEILQEENTGIKFRYKLNDDVKELIEFEQSMQELDKGALTINEYRKKRGKEPVEWGEEPYKQFNSFGGGFNNFDDENQNNKDDEDMNKLLKEARLEGFLRGKE